jgi:hypothetical protein
MMIDTIDEIKPGGVWAAPGGSHGEGLFFK